MKLRTKIAAGFTALVIATVAVIAQSRGTPGQLRVMIDSVGALVTSAVTATPPFTSVQFNNARLAVDASGNLLVTNNGGGGNPFDQDLNTFDVYQSAGFGIGIAGVSGAITGDGSTTLSGFASLSAAAASIGADDGVGELFVGNYQVADDYGSFVAKFGTAVGSASALVEMSGSLTTTTHVLRDAIDPSDNYINLEVSPYGAGGNLTQVYLQRSSRQNAIISLTGDGDDSGTALFDLFNPVAGGGPFQSQIFQVNMASGGDVVLELANNGQDFSANYFKVLNGAVTTTETITGAAYTASGAGTFTGNYISSGTSPAVANIGAASCGSTAATIAGTDNAPVITTGGTAWTACRVTFDTTAPNGWNCIWSNGSTHTLAATPYQSGNSTTTTDVTASTLGVAADVLTGNCFAR